MAEHLTKDEFTAHMGPIRDDIREIIKLQREANGRTGKLETRVSVLEDRGTDQRSTSKVSAGVSAVVSGVLTGLGIWLSRE